MLDKYPFAVACDLGCGSGSRLVQSLRRYPNASGIGIDNNPEALKLASRLVETESPDSTIEFFLEDVQTLSPRPAFAEVDLLFCFFMGHDLYPRERCRAIFEGWRTVFPNVRRFLFSDTCRSQLPPSPWLPTFTLGFEFTHAVMRQYLPTETEWLSLFAEAGWECVDKQNTGIPGTGIFDLRPVPRETAAPAAAAVAVPDDLSTKP